MEGQTHLNRSLLSLNSNSCSFIKLFLQHVICKNKVNERKCKSLCKVVQYNYIKK